jgi:hypothetical protein
MVRNYIAKSPLNTGFLHYIWRLRVHKNGNFREKSSKVSSRTAEYSRFRETPIGGRVRSALRGRALAVARLSRHFSPAREQSLAATMESSMSKASLDNRHRNHDGEISHKHGNTLIRTLRKIYGQGFAAGYPEAEKLSEVLLQLNETSLSQLRRDHETGHLEHKIANASK